MVTGRVRDVLNENNYAQNFLIAFTYSGKYTVVVYARLSRTRAFFRFVNCFMQIRWKN